MDLHLDFDIEDLRGQRLDIDAIKRMRIRLQELISQGMDMDRTIGQDRHTYRCVSCLSVLMSADKCRTCPLTVRCPL